MVALGGRSHVTKMKSECSREFSAVNTVQLPHPSGGEAEREAGSVPLPTVAWKSELQLPTVVASGASLTNPPS